ncbi:MAG: tRNA uridine-5-carboxymethylaminomethyl(34) synthesis GTPase MnmE [bacterium]|nr:tRNA uridine-5-carboxymethylaminomethyl(34) synthesis GTPase MnmE [bacterium]
MNIQAKEDTIIAIATPPGVGAISIVRLSGPDSFRAVDAVFSGKIKLEDTKSHTIHYGNILDENEIVDDVLVSVFRAPNSYTGEDSIEINIHGSPFISQRIISLIIKNSDVRLAEPGEFTKRAFLNGRLDLAQAEAVADLINSRSSVSLMGARCQLNGLLSLKVANLRKMLVDVSSFIELELDFAEEQIEFIKKNQLIEKISEIIREIDELLKSYSYGKVVREGINVVIVGEPNVGKSSLLNYLLKESRAIVSNIPGTTRDTIREEISIDGFLFKLHDTAGIRESDQIIEKEGIERSREAIRTADLILFLGDVNVGFSKTLEKVIFKLNSNASIIRVLNKIDLENEKAYTGDFNISILEDAGVSNLLEGLKNYAKQDGVYTEKDALVTNIRHHNCLYRAKENLNNALLTLSSNLSGEFYSSDLRAAEDALAELIGEVRADDILDNIFAAFCIGK